MDGQEGGSAIKLGEFSICSRLWADFLQKAVWPHLKMRKSLSTHTLTHARAHTHTLQTLQENISFSGKKNHN